MRVRFSFVLIVLLFSSILWSQQRVVSLSPIVTKTIKMLGADEQLVACTNWCPNERRIPVVADAINVNVEALVKVKPDIVFASTLVSDESIKTIQQLGIDLVVMPRANNFETMCDNVLLLGERLQCRESAQREIGLARARLAQLRESIDSTQQPQVMLQIGAKPIFVAIPNTFVDDYITYAGAVNCYADLKHGTVTRESVLMRNPEAIFLSIMPSMAKQERAQWASFDELRAAQNNKIILLDQNKTSAPTIHDFVDVLEFMVKQLYE